MTDTTQKIDIKLDECLEVLNQIGSDFKAIKKETEAVSKNTALTQRIILATSIVVGVLFIFFISFVYGGTV